MSKERYNKMIDDLVIWILENSNVEGYWTDDYIEERDEDTGRQVSKPIQKFHMDNCPRIFTDVNIQNDLEFRVEEELKEEMSDD